MKKKKTHQLKSKKTAHKFGLYETQIKNDNKKNTKKKKQKRAKSEQPIDVRFNLIKIFFNLVIVTQLEHVELPFSARNPFYSST